MKNKNLIWIIALVLVVSLLFLTSCKPRPKQSYQEGLEYKYLAFKTSDISLCFLIEAEYMRQECSEGVAEISKNFLICENADKIDACYTEVARGLGNVSICEYIKDSKKNQCYYSVASNAGNLSLCMKVNATLPDSKGSQFKLIDRCFQNIKACDSIEAEALRTKCFFDKAEETLNETYCSFLNYSDGCYITLAILKNDSSICTFLSKVEGANGKDECYFTIAQNILNSSVCENIINVNLREGCKEDVMILKERRKK